MSTLDHYLVSVGAVVVRGDRILFVHKASYGPRAWGLPSGFVEVGETLEEAAKRELLEETGVEAELEGLLKVVPDVKGSKGF